MKNHESSEKREETIIKGADPFVDARGRIDNYYLSEPVNWIGLIVSLGKGIMRANHYHPEQLQKVLVTSGSYISIFKDLSIPNAPIKHHLVQAGDLVITPPNIAHAQIFLEDTTLLNLVTGERKHENYGKHTIPYELIKKEEVEHYMKLYASGSKKK